ncbi:transporter [[Haemophilus] ducreyi]|uniref:ShlB/FhaC/HecB family hemolysin secretion/activation protein n=1 Tax=Haemophilus ducreyi TaxID=730 RepID=UPI0007CDC935|nr:ShlB/FhaC/HecB family hemolysin secretion/activation protein [[Haemophilus] ducreyi]ANF70749.1 transporter [[Haemophilus] ducreyi]ANF72068.1 transporter [[Haemophilus] ducreyi]
MKIKNNSVNSKIILSYLFMLSGVATSGYSEQSNNPKLELTEDLIKQARAADPLNQELPHLKNKEAYENTDQQLAKAEQFLTAEESSETVKLEQQNTAQKSTIKMVTIDMGDKKTKIDFDRITKQYIGHPLNKKVIFSLVKALTEALHKAGYSTSGITLKQAEAKTGKLEFNIVWGTVDKLIVAGKAPTTFREKAMLFVLPNLSGKIFSIHDLDQLVEVLNTVNKRAEIKVLASKAYGKSNLNILTERTRKWPTVTLGINNSGTENNQNGRNQMTLNVSWSDLLGTNDVWSFKTGYRLYKETKKNTQQNYSLSYIQPFSYYTLEIKASQSAYNKELTGFYTYPSSGKTQTANIKLSKLLKRNKEVILLTYGELEFRKQKSYVANRLVTNVRHSKATVGFSYIGQLWKGKLYTDISFASALNWLKSNRLAYDDSGETTLRLVSTSINWYRSIPFFKRSANYHMRIGAQYGFSSLYSDNQFSIGDEYTVRGFKGNSVAGDKGVYLSQTLTLPFNSKREYGSSISPFIGIDVGYAAQRKPKKQDDILVGMALGIKARIKKLSLSFTYGIPLKGFDKTSKAKRHVYYVNGSISF